MMAIKLAQWKFHAMQKLSGGFQEGISQHI
jgi:hypothetical protein